MSSKGTGQSKIASKLPEFVTREELEDWLHVEVGTVRGFHLHDMDPIPDSVTRALTGRKWVFNVQFKRTFTVLPSIHLGIVELDSNGPYTRVFVCASNVSMQGFCLEVHTWQDSVLYNVQVNWFAFSDKGE